MQTPNKDKKILIIEDSIDIQALLERLLRGAGYTVECAVSGREGLELLRKSDDLPKVILLDLMMVDMDGYEFRKEQEKDARTAAIPVVLMTAHGDIQSKSMLLGARAFLKKPFHDVDAILETVGKFVR